MSTVTKIPPPPPPASRSKPPTAPAPTPTATKGVAPKWGKLEPKFQPPRLVVNAVEGFGKTTLAAYAERPLIVMARGETGYETLLGAGLVPSVDAARVSTWVDTLALVDELIANDTGHQTIALDALGGFERMCHEHVCARDFKNDWGEKGFGSFQKGFEVSVAEWLALLQRLDRLRDERGTCVVILSHAKVRTHKNPLGADFDRWAIDVNDRTWGVTARWADAVLFGNFVSIVEQSGRDSGNVNKKGKGIGGTDRVLYTEQRDGFIAKNRYGLPESIDLPADPSASWSTLWSHIKREAVNA